MKKSYGENPADQVVIGDEGFRVTKPTKTDKMSKAAMKGKDASMKKQALLAALRKKRSSGKIPASPTR